MNTGKSLGLLTLTDYRAWSSVLVLEPGLDAGLEFTGTFMVYFLWILYYCGYYKSKRKAMNRNWYNQKANPALNTKVGYK